MPANKMKTRPTGILPKLRFTPVAEGAAGAHTVTGITTDDEIVAVLFWKLTLSEGAPNTIAWTVGDVSSEFSITAANTIDNTGGTSLADCVVMVVWYDQDWGDQAEVTY